VVAGVRHVKPLAQEGNACKAYSLGSGFEAHGCILITKSRGLAPRRLVTHVGWPLTP